MKTTKAEKLQRVEEVMKILVLGGEIHDIREHAKAEGWGGEAGIGLSDRQLWRYSRLAYKLCERRTEKRRDRLLARHLQTRRMLQARAMEAGDWRTALAIVKDEAELLGLYPVGVQRLEHSGPAGRPIKTEGRVDVFAEIDHYAEAFEAAAAARAKEQAECGEAIDAAAWRDAGFDGEPPAAELPEASQPVPPADQPATGKHPVPLSQTNGLEIGGVEMQRAGLPPPDADTSKRRRIDDPHNRNGRGFLGKR